MARRWFNWQYCYLVTLCLSIQWFRSAKTISASVRVLFPTSPYRWKVWYIGDRSYWLCPRRNSLTFIVLVKRWLARQHGWWFGRFATSSHATLLPYLPVMYWTNWAQMNRLYYIRHILDQNLLLTILCVVLWCERLDLKMGTYVSLISEQSVKATNLLLCRAWIVTVIYLVAFVLFKRVTIIVPLLTISKYLYHLIHYLAAVLQDWGARRKALIGFTVLFHRTTV